MGDRYHEYRGGYDDRGRNGGHHQPPQDRYQHDRYDNRNPGPPPRDQPHHEQRGYDRDRGYQQPPREQHYEQRGGDRYGNNDRERDQRGSYDAPQRGGYDAPRGGDRYGGNNDNRGGYDAPRGGDRYNDRDAPPPRGNDRYDAPPSRYGGNNDRYGNNDRAPPSGRDHYNDDRGRYDGPRDNRGGYDQRGGYNDRDAPRGGYNDRGGNDRYDDRNGGGYNNRPQRNEHPGEKIPAPIQLLPLRQRPSIQPTVCPVLPSGSFAVATATTVKTNLFPATLNDALLFKVYQFAIQIDTTMASSHQKRKIFYNFSLLTGNFEYLAYDGESLGYSLIPIDDGEYDYHELLLQLLSTRPIFDEFGCQITEDTVKNFPKATIKISMTGSTNIKDSIALVLSENVDPQLLYSALGLGEKKSTTMSNNDDMSTEVTLIENDLIRQKNILMSRINLALSTLLRHSSVIDACHAERDRIFAHILPQHPELKQEDVLILLSLESFISRGGSLYRLDLPDSWRYPLENGVYCVKSSYTAVRFLQVGPILNVDISAQPTYQVGRPLVDILQQLARNGNLAHEQDSRCWKKLLKYRAITTHLPPGRNSRISLHKIGPKLKDCTFTTVDGRNISIQQHFQDQYQIQLNPEYWTFVVDKVQRDYDENGQPIPGTEKKTQAYYPIEVLQLYSISNNGVKELNQFQTKKMLEHMTQRPIETLRSTVEQLQHLQRSIEYVSTITKESAQFVIDQSHPDYDQLTEDDKQKLSAASVYDGLTFNTTELEVQARLLPPPQAVFGQNHIVNSQAGEFRPDRNHSFVQPASDVHGVIKVVTADLSTVPGTHLQRFVNEVLHASRERGLRLEIDGSERVFTESSYRAMHRLDDWCRHIAEKSQQTGFKYIILAATDPNSPLYEALKRTTETDLGILTQCAESRKLQKTFSGHGGGNAVRSYVNNIILKINSKLGGLNYTLQSAQPSHNPLVSDNMNRSPHPTISQTVPISVFGLDVYNHTGKRSHAGVVSSFNTAMTQYNSFLIQQPARHRSDNHKGQDLLPLETIQRAFCELLIQFAQCQERPQLPQHLVIYRDGASESQLPIIMDTEISGIIAGAQQAYLSLFPTSDYQYKPTITFLVAMKRHHLFFVPRDGEDDVIGRNATLNVRAGTVIDTSVTRNDLSEFYLQAHASALGTGKSTCYQILYCSQPENVSMDQIQLLTNYLSYNHQRCYKATRIVSPISFSDLLCRRGILYSDDRAQDGTWRSDALHRGLMKKHFWL